MNSEVKGLYGLMPEEVLVVAPRAEPGVPIDAITAACSRSEAVLELLMGQFNGAGHAEKLSENVIANILWDVQGNIALIRTLAYWGHDTSIPDPKKVRG